MKAVGGCLGMLGVMAAFLAVEAWIIMLVAGALHHEVHEGIPAIGFTASMWVTAALAIIGGFFKNTNTGESK